MARTEKAVAKAAAKAVAKIGESLLRLISHHSIIGLRRPKLRICPRPRIRAILPRYHILIFLGLPVTTCLPNPPHQWTRLPWLPLMKRLLRRRPILVLGVHLILAGPCRYQAPRYLHVSLRCRRLQQSRSSVTILRAMWFGLVLAAIGVPRNVKYYSYAEAPIRGNPLYSGSC